LPIGRLRDDAGQAAHGRHVLAVELQYDVAVLDAAFGGGTLRRDGRHQRARVLLDAVRLGQVLGDGLDLDPEPAAAGLAELTQLVDDDRGRIRGHRETMPIEPPLGEMMAVFTPMTSPSMLNRGPPELPLLRRRPSAG